MERNLTSFTLFCLISLCWFRSVYGQTPEQSVFVQKGEIPIILTAPHGGTGEIPGVGPRSNSGVNIRTDNLTFEVTDELRVRLASLLGKKLYVVAAKFRRRYIDVNRDADVNDDGQLNRLDLTADNLALEDADAIPYYAYYHTEIRECIDEVRAQSPKLALLIDIHGQSNVSASILRGTLNGATVQDIVTTVGESAITGENGIFGRLGAMGYDVSPPTSVAIGQFPEEHLCQGLNGGFTVREYGKDSPQQINCIQLELGNHLRSNAARPHLVESLAQAIAGYYLDHVDQGNESALPPLAPADNPALVGRRAGLRMGTTSATGDFNQDGIDDLAVGQPGGGGKVRIHFGTTLGLLSAHHVDISQADAGANVEEGDCFGQSLAVGDFDGDGKDDLAVGSPGESDESKQEGLVIVFFARGTGMTCDGNDKLASFEYERLVQRHTGATGEAGDHFGSSLTAADFDNDGIDDLAIGVPDEDDVKVDDGMVVMFYGSNAGLICKNEDGEFVAVRYERFNQTAVEANSEMSDHFGFSLTSGNFDGDAFADLAVGVPFEDDSATNDGMVTILYGSSSGLTRPLGRRIGSHRFERLAQPQVFAKSERGDQFGSSLSSGDYDDDGFDDLAIGVPYENDKSSDDGMVVVYYGSTNGLIRIRGNTASAIRYNRLNQTHAEANSERGDRFGYSLSSGDLNGDGRSDLVVGVPFEDDVATDDGMAIVFSAGKGGLLRREGQAWKAHSFRRYADKSIGGVNEQNDRFGASIAVGNFNGDSVNDLALGVPGEDIGSSADVGSVVVKYGSSALRELSSKVKFQRLSPTKFVIDWPRRGENSDLQSSFDGSNWITFRVGVQPPQIIDADPAKYPLQLFRVVE